MSKGLDQSERQWSEGELVKLRVEKAIYGGKMMGSAPDGRVVWLSSEEPLAIGDLVSGYVKKIAKRSVDLQVTELITPSQDRLAPFCPHVARCGGCPWQALSLDQQLMTLERDIGRMLSRALGEELALAPSYVAYGDPTVEDRLSWGTLWRYTARLHIAQDRAGYKNILGFYGPKGLFDLDHCPVFAPILNELLSLAREQLLPVLEGGKSELRLSAAQGMKSGTISVSLLGLWPQERIDQICEVIERLTLDSDLLHGASLDVHTPQLIQSDLPGQDLSRKRDTQKKINKSKRHGRQSKREGLRSRAPQKRIIHLPEPVFMSWGNAYNLAQGVVHPASAFMQAHQAGNQALIHEVIKGAQGSKSIVELYAGSGNFTFPLARSDRDRSILALEYDQLAVKSLQSLADEEGLKIQARSQLIDSLPLFDADHIILDPPRAGAAQIMEDLAKCTADKITYISCHPAAFARDLAQLAEQGWRVVHARIFHLFPHSGHAEVYCLLSKRGDHRVKNEGSLSDSQM